MLVQDAIAMVAFTQNIYCLYLIRVKKKKKKRIKTYILKSHDTEYFTIVLVSNAECILFVMW